MEGLDGSDGPSDPLEEAAGVASNAVRTLRQRSVDEQMDTTAQMRAFFRDGQCPRLGHVCGIICGNCRVSGVAQPASGSASRRSKEQAVLYEVHHELQDEAKRILDMVINKYGDTQSFIDAAFGAPLSKKVSAYCIGSIPCTAHSSALCRKPTRT